MDKMRNTRILTASAMLLAIAVILGFFKIPVNQFMELRFAFLPIACTGMLFGPFVGGVVGALSSLRGPGTSGPGDQLSPESAVPLHALREQLHSYQFGPLYKEHSHVPGQRRASVVRTETGKAARRRDCGEPAGRLTGIQAACSQFVHKPFKKGLRR